MKKLFFIIVMFVLILNVNAEVDCSKLMNITHRCFGPEGTIRNFNPGETVSCELTFETTEDATCLPTKETLKEISFNLNNEGLNKSNEENGTGFTKNVEGNLYTFSRTNGLYDGLVYRYKLVLPNVSEDTTYNISLSNVLVKNNEDIEIDKVITGTNISIKVLKPLSTINTLSSLNVSNFNLTPIFSSNITDYRLTVDTDVSKLNITPTLTDSKSTLSGDSGEKALSFGENTFKVYVKSESNVTKTYTLIVTRQDNRSDENGLKSLTVSSVFFTFTPDDLRYDLEVENDVTSVKINSTLIDPKSSYVEGFGNATKTIVVGTNTFYVKVKAENESIKTYILNIIKSDGKSRVNTLRTLEVVGFEKSIDYIPETFTYSFNVSSLIKEVEIKSTMTSEKSTYVEGFGNRKVSLIPGLNKILIKVKSEYGVVKIYTINITREDPKDNTNLKSLVIDIEDFKYDPTKTEYEIEVSHLVKKLVIETTPEEEKTKVNITGNDEFVVGKNTIKIELTSESGKKKEYLVYVNRRDKASTISKLKNIIIENYDLNFNSNTYVYTIKIKDEDRLNITVEKLDVLTKYTVLGNNNLKYGSKIKIVSTAEDGSSTEYIIKITKDLNFIIPLLGVSLLVFIISITASKKNKNIKIIKKDTNKKRSFVKKRQIDVVPLDHIKIEPKKDITNEVVKSIPEIEIIETKKEDDVLDA